MLHPAVDTISQRANLVAGLKATQLEAVMLARLELMASGAALWP